MISSISLGLGGEREELARPGPDGAEDQRAVAAAAGRQDRRGGVGLGQRPDQFDGPAGVVVQGDDRHVGGDRARCAVAAS